MISSRARLQKVHILAQWQGTVDLVQRALMGIEITADVLTLNPQLPQDVKRFEMRMRYRGHSLDLWLTSNMLTVRDRDHGAAPIALQIGKELYKLTGGHTLVVKLR